MNKLAIFIYLFIGCFCPFVSIAQQLHHEPDSAYVLNEVVVSGQQKKGVSPNRQFSVGSKALNYQRSELVPVQNQSLSDYLQTNTAIYFKEYGKGMSSTISLRGTSASQTAVQWNGLDINMPTMGQTDFSLLPLFFFDAIEVHRSGESALYGNGAIGGSIQLQTVPQYKQGIGLDFRQCVGSYGYLFSGLGFRIGGNKWESRTQALYTAAENNFPFRNITEYGAPEERVNNAACRQYGVLQELYFLPSAAHELSLRAWYSDSKRQIQPFMSHNSLPPFDSIADRSMRVIAGYAGTLNKWRLNANAGYSYDYELFRADVIAMNKLYAKAETEYALRALSVKAGVQSEYIRPDVHAYSAGVHEWRTDIFLLARWQPFARLALSGGLRKNFVTDVDVPLSPSLGANYHAIESLDHNLKLRAAFSYNTKVPTLNDRYWGRKNTYLKPEKGSNIEAGADYTFTRSALTIQAYATGYYKHINNWIYWLRASGGGDETVRGAIFRPQNLGVVDAYGAEAAVTISTKVGRIHLEAQANYAYTAVVLRENGEQSSFPIDKQIPYIPLHAANAGFKIAYEKLFFQTAVRYTGKRHDTDYFYYLKGYTLTDISGGYTFNVSKIAISIMLQINNLFGVDYQNMRYFAMPGRTFNGTLIFKL